MIAAMRMHCGRTHRLMRWPKHSAAHVLVQHNTTQHNTTHTTQHNTTHPATHVTWRRKFRPISNLDGSRQVLRPETWTRVHDQIIMIKFRTGNFDKRNKTEVLLLAQVTHVNGWFPVACMRENFYLFHASNLSVINFRFIC